MPQVSRHNHFVPRFYLRHWSDDGTSVHSYRILVRHDNVPLWSKVAIRSLGALADLYTEVIDGAEVDEFERWINTEIEDPAVPAYERVASGDELSADDWVRLARFFGAQDVRTPSSLMASLERWRRDIPSMLEGALRDAVKEVSKGPTRRQPPAREPGMAELARTLRVSVDRDAPAPPGMAHLRAEVTPGRSMWLASMKLVLNGVVERLVRHDWSIAEPHPGWEWITSDQPTMRLNYSSPTEYTFEGGWDSTGTDLMLPLSPRHLLFTQVDHKHPKRMTFSLSKTVEIQRLLSERASREIYARRPVRRVPWFRPRRVDNAMAQAETAEWANWHARQAVVEDEESRKPRDDG